MPENVQPLPEYQDKVGGNMGIKQGDGFDLLGLAAAQGSSLGE